MTRSGVEHDLRISPFQLNIDNGHHRYVYHFSSQKVLERYADGFEQYMSQTIAGLRARFRMHCHLDISFLATVYYHRVEKRGFYMEVDGIPVTHVDELRYDGVSVYIER